LGDAEPEASAATRRLGSEEQLEEARHQPWIDAAPVVADLDLDAVGTQGRAGFRRRSIARRIPPGPAWTAMSSLGAARFPSASSASTSRFIHTWSSCARLASIGWKCLAPKTLWRARWPASKRSTPPQGFLDVDQLPLAAFCAGEQAKIVELVRLTQGRGLLTDWSLVRVRPGELESQGIF